MAQSDDERRAYHRAYFRRRYREDAEFREKAKKAAASPENLKRTAKRRAKKYHNDPEYRERVLEQGRKCYRKRVKTVKYQKRILEYSRKRRKDPVAKEKMVEYARAYRERKRLVHLVRGIKKRAQKNGLPCDHEFIDQLAATHPTHCPCCNCELSYAYSGKSGAIENGPSFDRVDCTKGYIAGNVEIICWRCNAIKRDATFEELVRIVEYMRKKLL